MTRRCGECGYELAADDQAGRCSACGSDRIDISVGAAPLVVAVTIAAPGIEIGYDPSPGWPYQWRQVQRFLGELRTIYTDEQGHNNIDVLDQVVNPLMLALWHLKDWVCNDEANVEKITEPQVDTWADDHHHLGLARAYANIFKHSKLRKADRLTAQALTYTADGSGNRVTIGHRLGYEPAEIMKQPDHQIDALALAEGAERDWRDLLGQHRIPIPAN